MDLYDVEEMDSEEEEFEEVESVEEEVTEEDESEEEDLFNKNTASFRCFAQVLLSSSSLMRNALYHFPPLEDPGLDETFDYVEPDQVFDDVGAEKYVRLCKELEIVPISRVVRSLPTKELNLRYYGLTLKQIKAITNSLQLNCHVEYLILEDNVMEPEAVDYVSQMLTENNTISYLNMKECRIGPQGAAKLCEGIETTQSVKELDLSFNSLGNEGLSAVSVGIIRNQSIRKLNLSRNQLSEECSKTLSKIVSENQLIEELDLSWNEFYTQIGLKNLCEGLTKNSSIRTLNLSWNGMGLVKEAMIPMVKYLKACETLEHLDLSNNRIGGITLRMVKAGVGACVSLKSVSLCNNTIKPDEAMFVSTLLTDPELPLSEIHLDCLVEKNFRQLLRRIKRMGKNVTIEGFLSDYKVRGPDERKLLFERIRYVCQKAKKKKLKKDFGLFLFTLPDQSMSKDDFVKALKKFKLRKIVKDKDMLDYLLKKFHDKNNVDCKEMRRLYLEYYPDTLPPPPKKKKKKKGKRRKKGKKKEAKTDAEPAVEGPVTKQEISQLGSSKEAVPVEPLTESEVTGTTDENAQKETTGEETTEPPGEVTETTEQPGETTETIVQTDETTETIEQPGEKTEEIEQPDETTETIEKPDETTETNENSTEIVEKLAETTEGVGETNEKPVETVDKPMETVDSNEKEVEHDTNKTQSQEKIETENVTEDNNETAPEVIENTPEIT